MPALAAWRGILEHFLVQRGAGLHSSHEDAQHPDIGVHQLTDVLDGLQHNEVAFDGVLVHLTGDKDVLHGDKDVDIEQAREAEKDS